MKKLLIILVLGTLFFSCSREDNELQFELTSNLSDRLVFSDESEFLKTYSMLAKYKTEDDLRTWAQLKNHSTLLDSQDTLVATYSSALRTILNKDYEYELGELIVWFNPKNGELLGYPKNGDAPDKDNPDGFTKIGVIQAIQRDIATPKWTGVPANGYNAIWQHEFTITRYAPCGGPVEDPISGMRKWVANLYHEAYYNSSLHRWYSYLWLQIKLEERPPSKNWRISPNYRTIEYSIEGTQLYMLGYTTISTSDFSESLGITGCGWSGQYNLYLAEGTVVSSQQYPAFNVSMSGWIRQYILGDNEPPYTFPSDYPGGELW